jgi:hypothetical protein
MRVLLRQTKTKLYYVSLHEWIADAGSAFDFDDVERAIKLSRDANLTEVEVVLAYDDPFCDLVLPLSGGQ